MGARLTGPPMAVRPLLITNPANDVGFGRAVQRAAKLPDGYIEGTVARLRPAYPKVVLRERDLSGETVVVWYAYREGVWVSD
jgi:hypothetical protein